MASERLDMVMLIPTVFINTCYDLIIFSILRVCKALIIIRPNWMYAVIITRLLCNWEYRNNSNKMYS